MIIKPITECIGDNLFVDNGSVGDVKNEIIVHDVEPSPTATSDTVNDLYGVATQVVQTIVKGFPTDSNIDSYQQALDRRNSYIQRMYFYTIYMSSAFKTNEERFKHAVMIPSYATVTGFTDARPIPDQYGSWTDKLLNTYSLTVYGFDNKILTTLSESAKNSSEIPFGRLDVCSPLDIINTELRNDYSMCTDIPRRFRGIDLLESTTGLIVKCVQNRSSDLKEEYNSRIFRKLIANKDCDNNSEDPLMKLMEMRMCMRNFIVDTLKQSLMSMLDEYILVYRSGDGGGFKKAVNPLNKLIEGYTIPKMQAVKDQFLSACRKLENRFNEAIRIMYYVTQHERILEVYLLKSNVKETKRMTTVDALRELISETLYNPDTGVSKFKHDFNLDVMTSYGTKFKDGTLVSHRGNL